MSPAILIGALCVVACGPTLIVLKDPKSGQLVQCQSANASQIMAERDAESCAKAYEREGWQRISN